MTSLAPRALPPPPRYRAERPRAPLAHVRVQGDKLLKGKRAKIQFNKDVKAWSEAKKQVEASREARVAAGVEDFVDDLEEEAIMSAPKPEMPNVATSCVNRKLTTFCQNPAIRRQLNSFVMDSNIMVAEAYAFANLHVTRLLERGKSVPVIDQSFYHACMTAVTECGSDHSDEMKESIKAFDALRPQGEAKVKSERIHDIREELAISMAAVASNHLWSNFESRLTKYLLIKYPDLTKKWREVVVDCVAVSPTKKLSTVPKLSLKTPKGKTMAEGTRSAIARSLDLITSLRTECPVKRVGVDCKAHTLLPLYYEILECVESAYATSKADATDRKQIARLRKARFSLLPNKNGFTVSSIPICGRALMAVLTSVTDRDGKKLAKIKGPDTGHDAAWRKHFNVNQVETRTRAFGGRISTDGVAVSIHLSREQANVLSKLNEEWDKGRIAREKGDLPVQYRGIDPGLNDVVTIASSRELKGLSKTDDKSVPATVTSYSASRYAERSMQKKSARLTAAWNRETEEEVKRLDFETDRSTSQGLSTFLASYLSVYRTLLAHRAKRGYRTARFMRYVFKQRTVSEICDLVAPRGAYNVVAYGDWRGLNGTPIKRRWAGPQEDIRRELQRRKNVLFWNMWEYKTSVTCHKTWRRLTNMRAQTTKFDRFSNRMIKTTERKSVHKVLHCRTSAGTKGCQGGGTWNRDANASRNMLMLMMLVVLGIDRPEEFKPAVTVERRVKQRKTSASSTPATTLSSTPHLQGREE